MNIIFFGTSDFGIPSLQALKKDHSLMAVVTTPDKPSGRGLERQPSKVKRWARSNQIPCFDYSREDPATLLTELKKIRPDLFVVISFGAILKSDYLTAPRLYSLNVHGSLLPKYRGAAPMQYALLNGDRQTGVSVIRMIERLDAGDILLQKATPVAVDENLPQLEKRLSVMGAEAILEGIRMLEMGHAQFTVQAETQVSLAKKISKNDGRLDWKHTSRQIHDRIRAFVGWPGSYFFFRKKRIIVWEAEVATGPFAATTPGAVAETSSTGLVVAAGMSTWIRLKKLQLEGKKPLEWKEFKKGFPLKVGDVLE